ncbi:unnamed protein product, partial [Didymodactylos carnosus]
FLRQKNDYRLWNIFTASQYSATNELPVRSIEPAFKQCFDEVVRTYMEDVNKVSRRMGRFLEYKKTLYGYYNYEPKHGINYILDLFLIYRKYTGKKMSVPVRKRVYVVQKFRPYYFRELFSVVPTSSSAIRVSSSSNSSILSSLSWSSSNNQQKTPVKYLNMIVPVSGRLNTLKRLMNNFDSVVLNNSNLNYVLLNIVLMETTEDNSEKMSTLFDYIQNFIHKRPIITMTDRARINVFKADNENFTRGYARSYGASKFNDTDLLFFMDLDMIFTKELFPRILHYTIFNKQVYFPIIFSQYDPQYWNTLKSENNSFSLLRDSVGYWRQYGFGMLGIYKGDLKYAGDWNQEISGWGKEDVEIYDKLVQSNLTVFRSVDNSLIHVFHAKECNSILRDDQMRMCKGTRSITLGSQKTLVTQVQKLIEQNKI